MFQEMPSKSYEVGVNYELTKEEQLTLLSNLHQTCGKALSEPASLIAFILLNGLEKGS